MKRNKVNGVFVFLSAFVLFNSACAQNPPTGKAYVQEENLVQNSTFLLNNADFTIPLQNLNTVKIASVHFANQYAAGFDSLLNKYAKVDAINGNIYNGPKNINDLPADLKWYNTVIVQLSSADVNNPQIIDFITQIQKLKTVIVALFGTGDSFNKLNGVTAPIIWSQRVTPVSAFFSAQAIFGGVAITQKLTSTFTPRYAANMGFLTAKTRLQYTVPEDAGVNSINLIAIDDIAREAILAHATPGCVVLVAKDGKVIFNKAYGDHTYNDQLPDKITDIFDIASLTKVTATTMEVMKLYDEGKISLDSTIGDYIPGVRESNKSDITVRELMEHQAGLVPDIPTYEKLKPSDHSIDSSATYPTKVSDNYFLRKDYFKDVMWQDILKSPLRTRGQYVYSDVSMVLMKEITETITSTPLNDYLLQQFYLPLGMQTAGFLPLYRFPASQIIPTEQDAVFRHSLLDGYTEDQTAALMGNVSGNAGLFASANDLSILYQMILNKGTYGGVQYIKPQTVDLFTAKQSAVSRRGLGFDRWDPIADHHYPSRLASPQTYGHTGYTGTCVWVDPKYNLVYVFLSNRVNPTVGSKLSSLNIRPRIQDAVYEAIQKGM
ncbi:MAG: serine hydrolase domain-containing protein [Sphingobacteriales bacterium]